MKKIVTFALFILISQLNLLSQNFKSDPRSQNKKEDRHNIYESDKITNLDILQALDLFGIKIHKFNIGVFDKEFKISLVIEEYSKSVIIETDTIFNGRNTYSFYENDSRFNDFITQLKVFTEQKTNQLKLKIVTNGWSFQRNFDYAIKEKDQFYNLRYYSNSQWQIDKKVPLLVFASSWKHKKYDIQRFCGAAQLNEEDAETKALLNLSPHYFKLSYIVSNKND